LTHPLSGIVTVGTPHFGAPLVGNALRYARFNDTLYRAVSNVFGIFSDQFHCCDWSWVLANGIGDAIATAAQLEDLSFRSVAVTFGLTGATPVIPEMNPTSGFLASLNSQANYLRETAQIPSRVGIVSEAHNFFWGGPLRAIRPATGDRDATLRDAGYYALVAAAWAISIRADAGDDIAADLVDVLMTAADILGKMDLLWCGAISWPGMTRCYSNDTVVPIWSQDYSQVGATPIVIVGPAHLQESGANPIPIEGLFDPYNTQSPRPSPMLDDVLYDVLTRVMHVPPRP
jgi:hypothetical protein